MSTNNPWEIPLPELYQKLADGSGKEWADNKESEILRDKYKWILFNILVWGLALAFFLYKPAIEPWNEWFSRFGSVLCLMSVLIEYYFLNKFRDIISFSKHETPVYCVIFIQRKFTDYVEYSKIYTAMMVVFGTIVWGYGDIILLKVITQG